MRRVGVRAQSYDNWDENAGSEYSQEEETSYLNQRTYPSQSPRTSRYSTSGQAPDPKTTPSASRRPQQSGIPRSSTATPSRLPSALRTPRSSSYSSSSSVDSRNTAEEIPPLPRNSIAPGQIYSDRTHGDKNSNSAPYADAASSSQIRPQSGLPRRSTSTSRSSSRSRSQNDNRGPNYPPPLPGSNSDSDGVREFETQSTSARDYEKTPNSASWAKDRSRFANTGSSPGYAPSRTSRLDSSDLVHKYGGHSASAASSQKASFTSKLPSLPPTGTASQIPNRPRMPSGTSKPSRAQKEQQLAKAEAEIRPLARSTDRLKKEPSMGHLRSQPPQSQSGYSQRYSTSHGVENAGVLRTEMEPSGSTEKGPSRGQREHTADSKLKPDTSGKKGEADVIRISSMEDMPLPVPPLPQTDLAPRTRTPRGGQAEDGTQPNAMSSPLETLLMGSNPGSTPTARRMSTPIRPERESSVYVPTAMPTTPATPSSRRFSEPSPGNGHGSSRASTKNETLKEPEAPPTILQRLARRASFSTGKSPKASNSTPKSSKAAETPRSQAEVEHNDAESPFGLDIVTPRAVLDSTAGLGFGRLGSEIGVAQKDSTQRQKSRQSTLIQPTAPAISASIKKPRSKVVDNVVGAQGGIEKLGSPFMGDGSPRFGIDERFRSPRARSKSGLRNNIADDSREEVAQELFDYYNGDDTASNTEDYLAEEALIATVLSSPRDAIQEGTRRQSISSSSTVQSKKRNQHQYSERATVDTLDRPRSETSRNSSQTRTPRARTPSRVTFSPNPPDTIRLNTRSSSESSVGSRFSGSSDERDVSLQSTSRFTSRKERGDTTHPVEKVNESNIARLRRNEPFQNEKADKGRNGGHSSQLPVPKKRNANSALFRALEQPYGNSPFSSNASTDNSSNSLHTSTHDTEEAEYGLADDSEQLRTVSSNLSSLNGDKVGDIRWSGTHELSSATDVLLHNITHPESRTNQPRVVIQEPSDAYITDETEDELGGSAYSDDAEYDQGAHGRSGFSQSQAEHSDEPTPTEQNRRMSMQDKRKAIHESWRASLEGEQLEQLKAEFDPMEHERQQAIREFHESEEAYVDVLQIALQLFVRPLRTQNQRQWISGLDADVMRLFDWLDDIANLHDQLLSALDSLRQENRSVLIGFSDIIRPFVPMMELYQPYVVRVEEVTKHIITMTLDPECYFGEFVRMQSALPECGQTSLEGMLSRPVGRLQEYVDIFKRILMLTPRGHPDYLATFSLLHSMHVTASVIHEVKSQEEEYNVIKSLFSRVRGLPRGITIVNRERRLLVQGILQRVYLPEDSSTTHQTWTSRSSASTNPTGRTRSGSESTAGSSTTDSSTARLKSSSTEHSMRSDSSATSYMNTSRDGRKVNRVSFLPHASSAAPPQTSRSRSRAGPDLDQSPWVESTDVYVLVFTDLIFLAKPIFEVSRPTRSPRKSDTGEEWNALDAIGVFRLLGVTDCSEQHGFGHLVSLDLLPVGEHKDNGNAVDLPMVFNITKSGENQNTTQSRSSQPHQEWFASFKKCYLHTLRSMSFPGDPRGTSVSASHEASRYSSSSSIMDILSGGLGLPKSPSQQLKREERLKQHGLPLVENTNEEREERGFWSERFRMVSEDMRGTYEGLYLPVSDQINRRVAPQRNVTKTCRSSGTMI